MKILSIDQQQEADKQTIKNEPIASIDLMERASRRWLEHARPQLHYPQYTVLAGAGNNGGDALCIARLLQLENYYVRTYLFNFKDKLSADCQEQKIRLEKAGFLVKEIIDRADLENLTLKGLLIDGIFGSGLKGAARAPFDSLIDAINRAKLPVLAIDIPSGLLADKHSPKDFPVVEVKHCYTFQSPKLSFLLPENANRVGDFTVVNIDLDASYLESCNSRFYYITKPYAKSLVKQRKKYEHKGSYGHAQIVAGNENMQGAALLSATACIKSGAGLCTLLSDGNIKSAAWSSTPELMHGQNAEKNRTTCIGPGLGQDNTAQKKLLEILEISESPIVIDADAINLLSKNSDLLAKVPQESIFTPHPKELERLIGKSQNDFEQLEMASNWAKQWQMILLIKRAHTVVALPNGALYFNSSGNPGMGTAGSGDVLSGIITGLLSQAYSPKKAATLGVYLHGLSGDIAAEKKGQQSLTATDIIDHLGEAFARISQ